MTSKLFSRLLLFSLFGIAMWFFGNLYEAIVIGPNMLGHTVVRMNYFQSFFCVTNPVFFYIPIPQLATVVLVVLFFNTHAQKTGTIRFLKLATVFQVASIILSIFIITQINMKLFFGDLGKYADKAPSLALLWNVLNICRVFLVGVALVFVFKAYLQTQKNVN